MNVLLFIHNSSVEVFANEVALATHLKGFRRRDQVAELVALARQHPEEKVRVMEDIDCFIRSAKVMGA